MSGYPPVKRRNRLSGLRSLRSARRRSCPCGRHHQRIELFVSGTSYVPRSQGVQKRLKDSTSARRFTELQPAGDRGDPHRRADRDAQAAPGLSGGHRIARIGPLWPILLRAGRTRLRNIVHSGPTRPLHEPRWCLDTPLPIAETASQTSVRCARIAAAPAVAT